MSEHILSTYDIPEQLGYQPSYQMLDRASVQQEGEEALVRGYKLVSANEAVFLGHFPNQAILPGVLQVAAGFQAAVLAIPRQEGKYPFLRQVKRYKFRNSVVPGDRMDVEVKLDLSDSSAYRASVTCKVGDTVASQGDLVIDFIDESELQGSC
ncbi:MAG: hypothetical protein D6820_02360, partial [Lentisphaerae bacterium]